MKKEDQVVKTKLVGKQIKSCFKLMLVTSVLGVISCSKTVLAAGTTQPVDTAELRAAHPEIRITDVVPRLSLKGVDEKMWHSQDELGRNAVILVLLGESPVLISKDTTPEMTIASIAAAAQALKAKGVVTKCVVSTVGIDLAGMSKEFDASTVRDTNGEVQNWFHPSSTAVTIVSIDKAGFLRGVKEVHDPSKVGIAMQQFGNPTPKLEIGKPAPDFSMVDMRGQVRRVADFRGHKKLLITFFPKCFTGGCANQLTSLRDEEAAFDAAETEVWAVSVDPAQGEKGQLAFAAHLRVQFPLIPDEGRNLSILYGAATSSDQKSARMTILIDKDGIIRAIDKNVRVYTHAKDILTTMKALGMQGSQAPAVAALP